MGNSYQDSIDSNILLHTAIAPEYKSSEPHYRKENIEKVREDVKYIQSINNGKKLLDIGCGMGFIIDIAKNYYETINGIDITPAMIEKVNTKSEQCDIKVEISKIEEMPFENGMFDTCSAYAVLHHLNNLEVSFREIYRVLKKGGVFYSALDPNYYFWKEVSLLDYDESYSNILLREVKAVKEKDIELEERFKIKKEIVDKAEQIKHLDGGIEEEKIRTLLTKIGFSEVKIKYEWFIGEGNVINDENKNFATQLIREQLREMLPLSRHLFKYVSIVATK